jgi:hypothetical protein
MTRSRGIALFSAVLLLGAASVSGLAAQTAAIEGMARAEDGGAPIPFALVRLVPADTTASPLGMPLQGITTADGRYRFGGVAAGRYRVLLLRIGFRPVLSDPVQVAAGETAQLELRVASQPVVLPAVTITPEVCLNANELAKYPQIQTLWQQAHDGAAVRTEIMARFRYRVHTHEEAVARKADGTPVGAVDQDRVSDPNSAVKNAANRRSERLSRGYYGPTTKDGMVGFYTADELDVLHEDFLREHCIVATAQRDSGEVGLRFRPRRVRRNLLDVAGTIWLDSATFLARRIELEYVDADDQRGSVRLDFSDVSVAGGTLRMPVGGEIDLRPSRTDPAMRTESRLTITYSGFVEVPRR